MYDGHSDPKHFLMSYEATISSWGKHCRHGEVLRHGSQERGSNMVFLPSPENNHVMAEAEGHAGNQFPDEASDCLSYVPMHTGP
jgi:hypothetical protein